MTRFVPSGLALLALCACGEDQAPSPTISEQPSSSAPGASGRGGSPAPEPKLEPPLPLVEEAAQRGLDYRNRSGEPGKATILEANGAGVAALDLGSDGDLDLVFAQGLPGLGTLIEGPGADLEVFRSSEREGAHGHFERQPGPGLSGWWTGLATADVNGDGRTDLIAGGFGSLRVLLQGANGELVAGPELLPEDERWTPGSQENPPGAPTWVTSLALCDLDRDGLLDLYVGTYLELDPRHPALGSLGEGALALPCRWKGLDVYCGPAGLVPQADRVWRGLGDGTFEEKNTWLPDHEAGYTLAVLPFDADLDGDTDIAVANDSSANLLLINDGKGKLEDRGFVAGIALSQDGLPEAGMGLASGDVNGDGRPDLAVTNFSDEPTSLYFGAAVGFQNETFRAGLSSATRPLLSWSVHLEDFDADGWLELYTANGHVYPQADEPNTGTTYGQPDSLWHVVPGERVRPVELTTEDLAQPVGTRGSALADVDGDGAPDLVRVPIDAPASLLMNRATRGRRLTVLCSGPDEQLEGPYHTPRDGMGTKVLVVGRGPGGVERALLEEQQTCEGYQSAKSPWLHFGLGEMERVQVRVLWPSGAMEELGEFETDRRLWIREGQGVVREEEL